jgi:hypothetical protein
MKRIFLSVVSVLALSSVAAYAEPAKLSDQQLDVLTAGDAAHANFHARFFRVVQSNAAANTATTTQTATTSCKGGCVTHVHIIKSTTGAVNTTGAAGVNQTATTTQSIGQTNTFSR